MQKFARREAIAAAYLGGCALLIPNTLPIVLGTFRDVYRLNDVEVGFVNSIYTAACFLVSVSAPFWLPRLPARAGAFIGALCLVAATLLLPHLGRLPLALGAVAVVGIMAGTVSAIGNAVIGRQPDPARGFGLSSGIQLTLAALFGLAAPLVIAPFFGASMALSFLAIGFLPGVIAALALSRRPEGRGSDGRAHAPFAASGGQHRPVALIVAFAGLMLYVVAAASFWIFVERIGEIQGIAQGWISLAVTAGIASAMLGSALFALRPQRLAAMIALSLVMASLSNGMVLLGHAAALVASLVLFNIAWGIAVPAFMSAIRALDGSGRYFVLATAALLLASALAGPPGGLVMQELGYRALVGICAAANIAVMAMLTWALRHRDPASPALQPIGSH